MELTREEREAKLMGREEILSKDEKILSELEAQLLASRKNEEPVH